MSNTWIGQTQGICIDGVNSAVRPDMIGPNQVAWGFNLSVRQGKPRTRPALVQRAFLTAGRVQGAGYFSISGGMGIFSISGNLYRMLVSGNSFTIESIPLGFANASNLNTAWMVETRGNFLVQDGQSDCIIYDGSIARRANTALNEVPIGRMMAFVNGRLWLAVGDYNLKAGDIIDGGIPNSELFFNESAALVGGGTFFFPFGIVGLGPLPSNNTSSGYGSLIIFGNRITNCLRAEITDRDLWQIIPGFEVVALDGIGACSHLTVTRVNQDLYWRDVEGQVRSLRSASADQESPGNSPLSREVSRITDFETDSKLDQSSGMYFDNRLFFTASPFIGPRGQTCFRKIIALDCSPLATMRGKSAPAYDGEWTGAYFVRMFKGIFDGKERAFVISADADDEVRLWEIMPQVREDSYLTTGISPVRVPVPIKSYCEFRAFDFGQPSQLKQITRCDIYPTDIDGAVSVTLQWRADDRTQWLDCDEVEFCAKMTDDSTDEPHVWKNLNSQERGRVKSYSFPQGIDPVLKMAQTIGFKFQIRLIWEGNVLFDRIDIWANPKSSPQYSNIPVLPEGCPENDVQGNEIQYSILP